MTIVLAALACTGHLVLMVGLHNRLYGLHLPRHVGKAVHLLIGLLVLALPAVLVESFGWQMTGMLDWQEVSLRGHLLRVYLGVCVVAGTVWLPLLTLRRALRKEPADHVRCEVVDVARQLGKAPVGDGRARFLARLPGNEVFQVEYVEKTIYPARLPAAWDGLTILHLSDLHLHGTPDRAYYQAIMERCAAWHPDVVAVTGDIADSEYHDRWILPVLGRLRWKAAAFAILGNHDYWQDVSRIRRRLRRLGMRVPENEWCEAQLRGERLVVIGNERPWLKTLVDLSGCPEGPFRLCLSHTPDNVYWGRDQGVDLMLAGHVHGGQIRLPIVGSMVVPSGYGRRFDAGLFQVGPTLLHVSRGISGEQPVRYNCRPEVTLLTLRRGRASGAVH
jgi:predicted MPP superfamily phosphohydrolase